MKKLYTITTALLMLAGTFTSCTKDLDEVGLNASSIDAAKKEVSATNGNGNKPVETGMTLSFSETTPTVGSTVTIEVKFSTLPIGGELRIEEVLGYNEKNEPIIGERLATYIPGQGPFTAQITKNVAGKYEYRSHYIPKGGSGFSEAKAYNTVEFINSECSESLTAKVTNATPLGNNNYTIEVTFTLNTCETYSNVKVQGGLTAHVSNINTDATLSHEVGQGNQIRYWEEASLAAGTHTYTVTFNKEMKGSDFVTGDWSAKSGDGKLDIIMEAKGAYFNINDWK